MKSNVFDRSNDFGFQRGGGERSFDLFALKLALVSLYLTPALNVFPGMPSLRIDDFLPLFWGFVFFLRKDTGYKAVPRRVFPLLGFIVLLPVSVMSGEMGLYGVSFLDLNQYVRFVKYIFVYVLALSVFRCCDEESMLRIVRFWLFLAFLCFVLAVTQYIDFLGLNRVYVQQVAPTQYLSLMGGHPNPRPVAMIGNPNELGFLFAISFMLGIFILGRDRWSVLNVIYVLAPLAGLFLTLSRGSLAALFGGVVVFFIVKSVLNKGVRPVELFFGGVLVLGVVYFVLTSEFVYEKFLWRFERGLALSEDTSFGERLHNWNENIAIIEKNFLVGVGPLSRAGLQYAADNEWLLFLRAYGVVGLVLFLWLLLAGILKRRSTDVVALHVGLVVASFLFMIPAAVFHSLELMPVVLIALGLIDCEAAERAV